MPSRLHHALWWSCVPLLPLVAWQGARVRRRVPRLPEADGRRAGTVGPDQAGALSIAVLGESTAASVGVPTQAEGLASQLALEIARRCGIPVRWQSVGRIGATVADVRSRLMPDLHGPVDVAILAVGVNDTLHLTPATSWQAMLAGLARDLVARGARLVVFSGVPAMGEFPALPQPTRWVLGVRAGLLDAGMRELAATLPATTHLPVRFTSIACAAPDGFHPSAQGYGEWAAQLATYLVPLVGGAANRPEHLQHPRT